MRRALIIVLASLFVLPADAFELAGRKQIALETKDGKTVEIGTVTFAPKDGKTGFTLDIDTGKFKTFFLSMRDFKCLEGPELECFVPYPYKTPATVTKDDLAWLAHSLLFFYKSLTSYGAPLGNGLYYDLKTTDRGIEGLPEAIDLNAIASPPEDPTAPPYDAASRDKIEDGARWISKLTITDAPTNEPKTRPE